MEFYREPYNDHICACLNTPTFGIVPDSWLYERSIDSNLIMEVDSPRGILPEKLLCKILKFKLLCKRLKLWSVSSFALS
ncbi:hypothetical protein L2E82_28218 [Cichorium intybus]|uniref:Uncharacterized protein n=1 Tax=Cichorium intybus TaxID=13427 RepID=A0ACB9CVC5_CICIN|nr:hypothetical protein L2E82_28218 [Cichorium intybus]